MAGHDSANRSEVLNDASVAVHDADRVPLPHSAASKNGASRASGAAKPARPLGLRLLASVGWVVVDFVIWEAVTWVVFLLSHILHGWNSTNFARYTGTFICFIGVATVWIFNALLDPDMMAMLKRHGHRPPVFNTIYFALALVMGYPLNLLVIHMIKFVYNLDDAHYSTAVWGTTLFTQLVFFIYGVNSSLCGGKMLQTSGWKMVVCLLAVTWLVWLALSNNVMGNQFVTVDGHERPAGWWSYNIFGGAIQSVIMTNLMFFSIGAPLVNEFVKPEWTLSHRMGILLPYVVLLSIFQWILAFLANWLKWPNAVFTGLCNGTWNIISTSWPAALILGYRVTPILWPAMTRKADGVSPKLGGIILYCVVIFVLMCLVLAAIYFFFHYVTWPVIWIKMAGFSPDLAFYDRLDFTGAFAMGTFSMGVYGNGIFCISKEEKAARKAAKAAGGRKVTVVGDDAEAGGSGDAEAALQPKADSEVAAEKDSAVI